MIKYLFILLLFASAFSCKKDESTSPAINFHGIMSTDDNGNIIYNNDTTDWKQNDAWSGTESGLFSTSKPICNNPINYQVMCFPNPCNGYITLHHFQSPSVRVAIRIVDRHYNVLVAYDSLQSQNVNIDLSKYKGSDTLRMYYKIITDNCECRGHGDIVVK